MVKSKGRLAAVLAAGLAISMLLAPSGAEARNGRVAAGVIGGLAAGAIIGSALGGGYYGWGPYPYYGYYGPGPFYPAPVFGAPYPYYGYGGCYLQRRVYWDGWRWRRGRVRVCY